MDLRAASQGCLRAFFWHVSPLGMFPRGLLFGVVWRIRAAGLPNRIFPQSVVKSPLGFFPACLPRQLQKWPEASFGMDLRAAIQVCVRASFWHVSPSSSKKEPRLLFDPDLRAAIQGCLKASFWHIPQQLQKGAKASFWPACGYSRLP